MLTEIRQKIRALTGDFEKSDFQIFPYLGSSVFQLVENNTTSVTEVLINGQPLQSGESFSYNSTTQKVTVTGVSFLSTTIIQVNYDFNKYNDSELDEYIRASLVWLSIYDYTEQNFELSDGEIYGHPTKKDGDVIALVASILIKPNCTEYRLSGLTVKCPGKLTREEKIENLLYQFKHGIGAIDVLQVEIYLNRRVP